uniref:SLC3A2_N domain-containing protein n=1 Tax=Strongyloides papillosus TaxID=174720 RepID=A0A0N5BM72_STREA
MGLGPSSEVKETVNIYTENNQIPGFSEPTGKHVEIKNVFYDEVFYWTKLIFAMIGALAVIYCIVRCCLKNSMCWELTAIFTSNSHERRFNSPMIEMGVRQDNKNEPIDEVRHMVKNEVKELFDSYFRALK